MQHFLQTSSFWFFQRRQLNQILPFLANEAFNWILTGRGCSVVSLRALFQISHMLQTKRAWEKPQQKAFEFYEQSNLHDVGVPDVQSVCPTKIQILHHKLQRQHSRYRQTDTLQGGGACAEVKKHAVHLENVVFDVTYFDARVFPTRSVCEKRFEPRREKNKQQRDKQTKQSPFLGSIHSTSMRGKQHLKMFFFLTFSTSSWLQQLHKIDSHSESSHVTC